MNNKIGVVIVLFYSKEFNFSCLLEHSNLSLILIDNTPERNLGLGNDKIIYIPLKSNYGIAAAQNIGIQKAKELKCSYIFFFDQDSTFNRDYIDQMVIEYIRLKRYYPQIAVLGPTVIDKVSGRKYKIKKSSVNHDCYIVPSVISSGTIFEVATFDKIGEMDERLFIDNVDDEWGWRATYNGYICCITTKVCLLHKIGQKSLNLMGLPFIISSPQRYYYQYRNFFWLLRRSYVPLNWKCKSFIRKLAEIIIIPCFSKQKKLVVKNILRGIFAGLFPKNICII